VGNAIRDGKLKVQPCERCGYGVGVCGHHEDYSRPLEVVWLCGLCHGRRHREINEERRQKAM
jgi:ribosomal protein S27AE